MELKDLLKLMWRNIVYIILGLILGAGLGSIVSKYQTPVYEASTKIFVSRTRQQSNSDMLSLSDDQLLAINIQMAKSQPVLNDVASQLGSKIDADNIQIDTIPNTLILQIKVQDYDPQRAAAIANLLVKTLIQQNEDLLSGRYLEIENGINQQLDQVQKQIDDLQARITQTKATGIQEQLALVKQQIEELKNESNGLEKDIANYPHDYPTPLQIILLAEKQVRLEQVYSMLTLYQQIQTNLTYTGKPGQDSPTLENPQLTVLQSALDVYKQINITLINNRESIRLARAQSRQNVTQIVSVSAPKIPVRPLPALYLLLGGGVGLVLTAIVILILAQLDDSLKSTGQIEDLLGLPVLGSVFDHSRHKDRLITTFGSASKEVDAMRTLGTNLEIAGIKKNIRTLLIVNAEQNHACTSIAANLAIVNAQLGKQVILLDGDLRHPHLHGLFGLENEKGFAELLNGKIDLKSACHEVPGVKGMDLIPAGRAEKDLTGWLTSEKLTQLVSTLKKHADLVIVDCPTTDTADAQILASRMDAVLLTIWMGHTQMDAAQAVLKRFQLIGARLTGTVLYRKIRYSLAIPLPIKPVKKERPAEIKHEIESSAMSVPQ